MMRQSVKDFSAEVGRLFYTHGLNSNRAHPDGVSAVVVALEMA